MNRIERISAILIQLQSKRVVKGQELADRFGISLRTVYRDIRTLEESGVPVVGEAGAGFSLMDGYRLPPVSFTKDEAISFITAEKLLEKFSDPNTFTIFQSGLYKIKAVLRSDEKEYVNLLNKHIAVLKDVQHSANEPENKSMSLILQAIAAKRIINIRYFANHSQEQSDRKIEPVGVFFLHKHWYLIAFCHLRNDYRHFRIDRMLDLTLTGSFFETEHPALQEFLNRFMRSQQDLQKVILRVKTSIMRHLGEQMYYNGFVSQRKLEDETELTFLTSSMEGMARWLLMFGDQAVIVSPAILRKRVKIIAKEILDKNK